MSLLPSEKESLARQDINTLIGEFVQIKIKLNNTSSDIRETASNLRFIIEVCTNFLRDLKNVDVESKKQENVRGLLEYASGMKTLAGNWSRKLIENRRQEMLDEVIPASRVFLSSMINAIRNLDCDVRELDKRIKDL